MRYPQGGGLTAERPQFREELRLKAAERFARGEVALFVRTDSRCSPLRESPESAAVRFLPKHVSLGPAEYSVVHEGLNLRRSPA